MTELTGTEHSIYRKDGKVYLYKVGAGEPVLFIHGVRSSGWTWRKSLGALSRQFSCYVVDMPGYDRSDIPLRQYSMEDFADAMLDVLDAAGLERVHIVGEHTGAILAVLLAGEHPDRVNKLVLDGLPYWSLEQGKMIWEKFFQPLYTDVTSYHLPVFPLLTWEEAKATGPGIRLTVAGRLIQEATEEHREIWEKQEQIHRRSRLWERYTHESTTKCDIRTAGSRVSKPTLLLYGDRDSVRPSAEKASASISGSIFKEIPDCPGYVHAQQPDHFVQESSDFLRG
jgi:pimeloyl-ACP methyl ester carboxylesterase